MRCSVSDYKNFYSAVQNNKLVYLFGTGISSSLTGKVYSWKKWVIDSTGYMSDAARAEEIQESIKADDSTGNLLAEVKSVLAITKKEGTYSKWMQDSFETNCVTNRPLAETLKKLLITQDIFATTNYDLLLEQATGLLALSYEQADQAFLMLDNGKSDAVLHIHGIYDSVGETDNIIADEEQYAAILNDRGAQFIQQILGTRTLIFVGCGQTTEDANIAQFIRFANDVLHIDRDYYFLCRSGEAPDDLPPFIKSVPYGDEYDDLPLFLEEVAQIRLRSRIENSPIVSRTAFTERVADAYGLAEYHYSQQYLKFCGRNVEMARLWNFYETDRPFLWWAVTGQGGAGKSRLVLEFIRKNTAYFFGFFLNCSVELDCAKNFQPFNDTVAIVDYVKGNEVRIADTVSLLIDKFTDLPYKLRILFIERENTTEFGSWHYSLTTAFDIYHRAKFNDAEYNLEPSTRKHRFLYLDDLDEASVEELIGEICKKGGLPADAYRNRKLKEDYAGKFEQLRYRPLFLQMFVEAWIGNGCLAVEYNGYKQLIQIVVKREQERILGLVGGDVRVFNALIHVMICAGLADGLFLAEIKDWYPEEWGMIHSYAKKHAVSGVQRTDFLTGLLKDAAQDILTGTEKLHVLYPDIIKEYMFLYYLDGDDIVELSRKLWNTVPEDYNAFLGRCLTDFQHEDHLIAFIREQSSDYGNLNAMAVRQSLLAFKIIASEEDARYFLQRDLEEYKYWKEVPVTAENSELCLQGLYLCVRQLFGWSRQESFEAIDLVVSFEAVGGLCVTKVQHLLEFAHYLIEKDCVTSAQNVIRKAEAALADLGDSEEKKELYLSIQREIIVSDVYYKKWDDIEKRQKEITQNTNFSNERQSELYAYVLFSGALKCQETLEWSGEHLLMFTDALQDYAEDYAAGRRGIYFNDKVHYYYLHAKLISTEVTATGAFLAGMREIALKWIDGLIDEIKNNMMISDFAGLLVGARALKVGFDDSVTDEMTAAYFEEADELLACYPDSELLAEKTIDLWETAYGEQYKSAVPRNLIDRAYTLVLRFPKSKKILGNFFEMLKTSTEVGRWMEYTNNKSVVCGLQENNLFEYLLPPDIKPATVVRLHRKIGANEPCPCGSGRKFKKCCKGKGKYD